MIHFSQDQLEQAGRERDLYQMALQYRQLQRVTTELKKGYCYNAAMAEYFRRRHAEYKKKGVRGILRTAFYWLRSQHYRKTANEIELINMLNERGIKLIA